MLRDILKSKIHRATVTDANLNYNGSITIDPILLKLADILEFEKVSIVNLNNGQRFDTYAIAGIHCGRHNGRRHDPAPEGCRHNR